MQATQTLEQWFEQADNALPIVTETARFVLVGVGVLLCLVGGRLIKAACIVGGLMLGMIAGGLALPFVDSAPIGVGLMVALGLLGALGAWLMFRMWVAFAAAVLFAALAPMGMMIYQGTGPGELTEDNQALQQKLEQRYEDASSELNTDLKDQVQSLIAQGDAQSLSQADTLLSDQGFKAIENARGVVFRNLEDMGSWWSDNSSQLQRNVGLAMLIGGGVGLLFGLMMPTHAVSVQSAIVGAILMVIPGRELLVAHLPQIGDLLPQTAQGTLILVGLITAGAILLQWTLYLRRVDKES